MDDRGLKRTIRDGPLLVYDVVNAPKDERSVVFISSHGGQAAGA